MSEIKTEASVSTTPNTYPPVQLDNTKASVGVWLVKVAIHVESYKCEVFLDYMKAVISVGSEIFSQEMERSSR